MTSNQNKRELLRQKRKEQKRRKIYTTALITVAVLAVIGLLAFLPKLLSKPANYDSSQGFSLGDPNAPVKVVAFSSYTCGYCKIFSESLEKDFIEDFVDTGKVYYRYVNMASASEESINAAEASHCAEDQNKFFEYKGLLYTYASAAEGFSVENLIRYANAAGLDVEAFEACMLSDQYAQAYRDDRSFAQSVGVTATPTFLVNDQLVYSNELITTVENQLSN